MEVEGNLPGIKIMNLVVCGMPLYVYVCEHNVGFVGNVGSQNRSFFMEIALYFMFICLCVQMLSSELVNVFIGMFFFSCCGVVATQKIVTICC